MSEQAPRILFIDDDSVLADIYRQRLRMENFDVEHIPDGELAMQVALDYKPDLVVLDLMLPKLSGFDVLDIMRNTPETRSLKIIVFSALGSKEDRERAMKLGADGYIVKSEVTLAEMMEKLRQLLPARNPGAQ